MKELMTYGDVAKILKVSERTVWALVDAGKLRACKIKRCVRVTVEALEDYVRSVQESGSGGRG